MTRAAKPDRKRKGFVTWIGMNSGKAFEGDVTRAVFLLAPDGRTVKSIKVECTWDRYVYLMTFDRNAEDRLEGSFRKYDATSRDLLSEGSISCTLIDSLSRQALLLGLTRWVEDTWELDWKAELKQVDRIRFEEWSESV